MLNALYEALTEEDHCAQLLLHIYRPATQWKGANDLNRLHRAVEAFDEEVELGLIAKLTASACLILLCTEEIRWHLDPSLAPLGHQIAGANPWVKAAEKNRSFLLALDTLMKACQVCHAESTYLGDHQLAHFLLA